MQEQSSPRRRLAERGPMLVRNKLQGKTFVIPSIVTVIGIFCGFLSIIHAIKGNYQSATSYIGLAIILDGLDGRLARRLNATSPFGQEIDSLSDVVAFGVAPAILVYNWGFGLLADEFGVLVAFCYLVCGATRLARFNVDTKPRRHFQGYPIPAAAGTMAAMVYLHPDPLVNPVAISAAIVYTLVLAALMVSTVPFFSVKNLKLMDGDPKASLVVIALIVALIWYHSRMLLLALLTVYVLSGPIGWFVYRIGPEKLRARWASYWKALGLEYEEEADTQQPTVH